VNLVILAHHVEREKDDSVLLFCRAWTFDSHGARGCRSISSSTTRAASCVRIANSRPLPSLEIAFSLLMA
jgi:hypothetical protein